MKWARHSDRTHTRKKTQCEWEWAFLNENLRDKNNNTEIFFFFEMLCQRDRDSLHTYTSTCSIHSHSHSHIGSKITKENCPYRFLPILSLSLWIHCYGKLYEIENEWLCLFWGCCFSLFFPLAHTPAATCTHCSVYSFDYFYLGFVISNAIVPKQFKLNRQPYSNKTNWQRTTHERPIEQHTKKEKNRNCWIKRTVNLIRGFYTD